MTAGSGKFDTAAFDGTTSVAPGPVPLIVTVILTQSVVDETLSVIHRLTRILN